MEEADGTPRRPLSVRTTSNGAGAADGSEVPGEPVSPSARLAEDLYIVVLFGLGTPVNISAMRACIGARMASHPRFHSIQTTDKKGIIWWAKTTVSMDYHVSCPELDSVDGAANPDQAVEDYVASLSTQPMDNSRPLWKFDILNFPTSESASTIVMRVHHSLGDGMSLLTLFLSCTRSAADPTRLPVMPPLPVRTGAVYAGPRPPASAGTLAFVRWVWSFAKLTWHTAVDVVNFFATVLFLKDTQTLFTVMKNDHGELRCKRIVHRSLSLEDVKSVKQAMNCIAGHAVTDCLSRIPRLRSRIRPSQSPCGVESITVAVVPLLEVFRYELFPC